MNLSDVKQTLNIDFPDQDDYLTRLMNTAYFKAKSVTGLNLDKVTVKDEYPEIYGAILDDIAFMYQGRGDKETSSAIRTYKRYSACPMFSPDEKTEI